MGKCGDSSLRKISFDYLISIFSVKQEASGGSGHFIFVKGEGTK